MRTKKIYLILALLCTIAQGLWAQDSWDAVYALTQTTSADWTTLNAGSTTGKTLGTAGTTTYYYATGNLSFTNSTAGGSGLKIQGTVYLYVPEGKTVTCTGANASGQTGGGAGIELAAGNSLYLLGNGTINATGGNAANGGNGGNGYDAECTYDESILGGSGGTGGNGGGGAGAGIGTRGATGGSGGSGGQRNGSYGQETTQYGVDGSAGSAGGTAAAMGSVYVFQSSVTLNATAGSAGSNGTGGCRGKTASQHPGSNVYMASGGGGGGAGGFGGAASNIGTGGPGGGGGGGGAAGNVAWVVYSGTANGYYHAGAYGGKGGQNANGSYAPDGADVELDNPKHADIQGGGLRDKDTDYDDDDGWENGNGRHAGGLGGATGTASTSGSAITLANWPTQGAGTQESPSIISSTEDWNNFAYNVNNEQSYSGKYVKLSADISVTTMIGLREDNPFSGTFLGDGHTITANLSSTTTGTGANEQGVAPFHYIKNATIKNLTIAGTIASASFHTSGLVGFAEGTNLIEGCIVNATLNISSDYAGGFIGHGLSSATTIKNSIFADTISGVGGNRSNIGGIWGWSDSGTPTLQNCLEKGTYLGIASMHPMGLQSNKGSITNCYYMNPQVGSPSNACTVSGAAQSYTAAPDDGISKVLRLVDGNDYYTECTVSGVKRYYQYTGSVINIVPTITVSDGTTLNEGTDYTYTISPATVQATGDYTLTITAQGSYNGSKAMHITVSDKQPVTSSSTTLTAGEYLVYEDVTISERITISGNVMLNLGEGTTLYAPKGIEVSSENNANLTINGPGTLTAIGGSQDSSIDSGIGSKHVGTIVINGGTINAKGAFGGAGIGGSFDNEGGGKIIINGGVVNAEGGPEGAGIGGGRGDFNENSNTLSYGFCGDIVINGGQVTAKSDAYDHFGFKRQASGIGPGYIFGGGSRKNGTLTLGWTNPDDFIECSSYTNKQRYLLTDDAPEESGYTFESITFTNGFLLDGTTTVATAENIKGDIKKIVPYIPLTGTGTENDPYTIGNAAEWKSFAYFVNAGNNYSGQFVKLTDDIEVTEMVGTSETNSFQGTFLGNNHTLTFTQGSAKAAFGEEHCAPFRFTKDATIRDLKVDGDIYTSQKLAAGLVSRPYGTTNITNCAVSTNIYSSVRNSNNNDGAHGGLVAMPNGGTLNITGCAYTGRLLSNSATTNCGGFVGWYNNATITITNSLYAPSGSIPEGWSAINAGATFVRDNPTLTNCYYTETLGTAQGTQAYAHDDAPAYLGEAGTNYGYVTAYANGLLYGGKYYVAPASITLDDGENADNRTDISNANGYFANVTLADRTLFKDGKWNTLCLPFNVTISGSPLDGATARPLESASIEGTTLNLTFGDIENTLVAGTPYIIKWASNDDLVNPVFSGVTIDKTDRSYDNGQSGDKRIRFIGTYASQSFDAEDKSILFLVDGKTLSYPLNGASIGAQRAYFKIGEDGAAARRVTAFNINFGDDGETTGIISISNESGRQAGTDGWYALDGHRLNGKPSRAGVYIYNGNKTVIK